MLQLNKFRADGNNFRKFRSLRTQVMGYGDNNPGAQRVAIIFNQHNVISVKFGNKRVLFCHCADQVSSLHLTLNCDKNLVSQFSDSFVWIHVNTFWRLSFEHRLFPKWAVVNTTKSSHFTDPKQCWWNTFLYTKPFITFNQISSHSSFINTWMYEMIVKTVVEKSTICILFQ